MKDADTQLHYMHGITEEPLANVTPSAFFLWGMDGGCKWHCKGDEIDIVREVRVDRL